MFSCNFNNSEGNVLLHACFLPSICTGLIAQSGDLLAYSPTDNVIVRHKGTVCTFSFLLFSYKTKLHGFTYFYIKLTASVLGGNVVL